MLFESLVDLLCEKNLFELSNRIARVVGGFSEQALGRFSSIFPDGKLRIVIPFRSDPVAVKILEKFRRKDLKIDFGKGVVRDSKSREYRIGKYILGKKSGFTDEEKNWFVHQGQALEALKQAVQEHDLAVVISRSPLDIVRMSDHEGFITLQRTMIC